LWTAAAADGGRDAVVFGVYLAASTLGVVPPLREW
jgi:hypothetical protein